VFGVGVLIDYAPIRILAYVRMTWRFFLNAKQMTGGMLILGPLLGLIFWMVSPLGLTGGLSANPTTPETLVALGGDSAWAGICMIVASIGFLLWVAGMATIRFSMAGGSGDQYVNLGMVSLVIALATLVAANALIAGTADSAAIAGGAGMAAAAAMWGGSQALDTFSSLFLGIGLLLFGVGWLVQKNVQPAFAGIAAILGIVLIASVFADLNSTALGVIWVVFTVWSVGFGISRITASD
jgi:hypothetical protein